jgi:hypothetical protein
MRSLIEINKKIYDVSELKVGKWYISYYSSNNRRFLFRFKSNSYNTIYVNGCYSYYTEHYYNDNSNSFVLSNGYYCVRAKMSEVREYFP